MSNKTGYWIVLSILAMGAIVSGIMREEDVALFCGVAATAMLLFFYPKTEVITEIEYISKSHHEGWHVEHSNMTNGVFTKNFIIEPLSKDQLMIVNEHGEGCGLYKDELDYYLNRYWNRHY